MLAAVIDMHITSAMPSVDTTFSPDEAHYRVPLRRVYLLDDLALEIHSHNVTKRCVVDFLGKNESLRSAVWQAEQTLTMLRQQLSRSDDRMVGKIKVIIYPSLNLTSRVD